MLLVDNDLIEAFLDSRKHYSSITVEIDKSRNGKICYEYIVYMLDGLGESEVVRFHEMDKLDQWLVENTRTL
jgi:hypothetical protein